MVDRKKFHELIDSLREGALESARAAMRKRVFVIVVVMSLSVRTAAAGFFDEQPRKLDCSF